MMDELNDDTGRYLEKNYVKKTYEHIANDFSSTRYKKWPKVNQFIQNLPDQTLLLDVGCGNGKYLDSLTTDRAGFSIGCDISSNLLSICRSKGFEVVLCDMTRLPFRASTFDSVVCIAALHHIVGTNRRQKCLRDIVEIMSENNSSRVLIQVWSYEQDFDRDNSYLSKSRMNSINHVKEKIHIEGDIKMQVHVNRTPFTQQDLLVPFNVKKDKSQPIEGSEKNEVRHLRYYHVFKEKELDSLIEQIDGLKIIDSYYDKGNWCVIASKSDEFRVS